MKRIGIIFTVIIMSIIFVPTISMGATTAPKVPMKIYTYPITSRFKPLNNKIKKAISSGKTVTVKTTLSYPECEYYRNYLIFNTTIFRYATYHAYRTLDANQVIVLKQRKFDCAFVVHGEELNDLVAECEANVRMVDKAIKELEITGKTKVKVAISSIADYLYYRGTPDDGLRYAHGLLKGIGGNCAANASAFKSFMIRLGLPCEFVIGYMDGYCHAWNRVKIDGTWYYIDVSQARGLREKLWSNYTSIIEKY